MSTMLHVVLLMAIASVHGVRSNGWTPPVEQYVNMVFVPVPHQPIALAGPPRVHPMATKARASTPHLPATEPVVKPPTSPLPSLPAPTPVGAVLPISQLSGPSTPSPSGNRSNPTGTGREQDAVYGAGGEAIAAALLPDVPWPEYPPTLDGTVSGVVTVQYIVDTLGHVESGSIRVLSAPHPLLGGVVRDWLERTARFIPAHFPNGKKIRQLSDQDITFKSDRR